MHECVSCGDYCWCDLDDIPMPPPRDCRHECDPDYDAGLDGWYDEDEDDE